MVPFFKVGPRLRRSGWAAAPASSVDITAAGPTGVHKLSRHTPRSRLFVRFFDVFFFSLRFPAPRLLFNCAQFHSLEVRGFPRLFYASSLYSSLADFCSGERRLFLDAEITLLMMWTDALHLVSFLKNVVFFFSFSHAHSKSVTLKSF